MRVRGGTAGGEARGARAASSRRCCAHLDEAGLGHVSEIADGDPPHTPRGCPFQAWSVGELLRLDRVILAPARGLKPRARATSDVLMANRTSIPSASASTKDVQARRTNWKRWGPYLTERQWGTVREDSPPPRIRRHAAWKRWGPYLSERAWGTVREDYSADGTAWEYFPHDHARSRAYRWGEDGLAASATATSTSASPWRCGTAATRS